MFIEVCQVFYQRAKTGWVNGDHVRIDMQPKRIIGQQAHTKPCCGPLTQIKLLMSPFLTLAEQALRNLLFTHPT